MANSFYKFCSSIAYLPEILSGKLKFTPPADLNDPSEMMPRFDFDEVNTSLTDLRARGHTELELKNLHKQAALMSSLCPELQALPAPRTQAEADEYIALGIFDDIDLVYSMLSTMTKRISERIGMCCLTKKKSSLPMWSHYANRAKGYLVEYQNLDTSFKGDATGLLNIIRKVEYSREISGVTFYPDSYDRIFFTKFCDWQYEQEYRVVCRLRDCDKTSSNGTLIYAKQIPVEKISSVTLGWMMSKRDRETAKQEVKNRLGKHTKINCAHLERGEIKVEPAN